MVKTCSTLATRSRTKAMRPPPPSRACWGVGVGARVAVGSGVPVWVTAGASGVVLGCGSGETSDPGLAAGAVAVESGAGPGGLDPRANSRTAVAPTAPTPRPARPAMAGTGKRRGGFGGAITVGRDTTVAPG